MAIGITGANNGYSRKVADERFIQTAGGTVTGNLTVTGTLSTTLLEALSANITVIDIKQYELSGFNVQGNATVQGSVSATGVINTSSYINTTKTTSRDTTTRSGVLFNDDNSKSIRYQDPVIVDGFNYYGYAFTEGNTYPKVYISSFGTVIPSNGSYMFSSVTNTPYGAPDVMLSRDSAGILAQRNGLNAQESRIYSTYTDTSNYERFFIKTNVGATSATQIGLSAAGTGQNRSLEFVAGGSTKMTIASTGNVTVNQRLNFAGDASGANNLFFLRNSSNNWTWGSSGVGEILGISGNTITIGQDVLFSRAGITIRNIGESVGATLLGEATDVLAQRRRSGNAAQESRIYSTYTDASNYERFFIKTNVGSTSATQIGLSAAGTGQNRDLQFVTGGSTRMSIANTGSIRFADDGSGNFFQIESGRSIASSTSFNRTCGITFGAATSFRGFFCVSNTSMYGFSPSIDIAVGTTDTSFSRISAGIVGVGTGTPGSTAGSLYLTSLSASGNIISLGNVGIGTTTPTAKLDILDTTLAGSGSLSGSALNIAQTWNTTGTPTAIKLNVTDTASNAASLLADLQVGGVSKFNVSKKAISVSGSGFQAAPGGSPTEPFLTWNGRYGVAGTSTGGRIIVYNSAHNLGVVTECNFGNGGGAWAFMGQDYTSPVALIPGQGATFGGSLCLGSDARLISEAAGVISQRNDVNPQESRIYGTYSSSGANYERFFVKTNTGGSTQIGLSAAGTGQNRDLQFVTGGSTRMTVTSGGDIGVGTSSPTAKFDVVGNGLFRSATTTDGASLKVTNGSTAQCTVGFGAGGNTFPGIWLNQPSPTFSNYAFLGSTTDTFFNAPFNGFIYFRNSNVTHMMVDKSGVHIPGVPFVANPANNRLTVACVATTKIGIVVQGASGQTADLQQWTNVSNTPLAKITNEGDIEITNSTNGIILKSPDGTRYRITVTNGGALSSTDLTPAAPTTSPPTTPPP